MEKDKIVSIFEKKKGSDFAGFEYVKLNRDSNGLRFNEEKLLEYAKSCHYIVRVMRTVNKEVCLYNFDVTSDKLYEFIKSFEENSLKGTIIEIEKFIPKGLA
jgi:hypothetical protein